MNLRSRLPAPVRARARRVRALVHRRRTTRSPGTTGEQRRRALLRSLDRPVSPVPPAHRGTTLAVAAGPRLREGLAAEATVRDLTSQDWSAVLQDRPDLVLLEWTPEGTVPGLDAEVTRRLLARARQERVPTVAWATCAAAGHWPVGHPVRDVDHWYADDPEAAAAWSELSGRDVGVLAPAASPRRHTPADGGPGQRRDHALAVLVPASALRDRAEEVDATLAHLPTDQVDIWPTGPHPGAPGDGPVLARPPDGVATPLARYRAAVIRECSPEATWPALEAAMAGTPLLLDPAGTDQWPTALRGLATTTASEEEWRLDAAARLWQRELTDREGLAATRAARAEHTFGHRLDLIRAEAGLPVPARDRTVTVITSTNRPHELPNIRDNVVRQAWHESGRVQLVLVLHGIEVNPAEVRAEFADHGIGELELLQAEPQLTLGACLNLGIDASSGRYLAKVDDDNFYGRHYLTDLVNAFDYSGADVVGKWAYYVWLQSSGAVLLRSAKAEYRFERLVQGGSIVADGDLLRQLRFADLPRAVDTDLLNRVQQAGARTFSADRFNFVSVRGTDRFAHTWPIADTALMNRAGELQFFGDPRIHVEV